MGLRILYSIHLYPPKHNCGGEWMIHHINKFLISRGHHVRVILHQAGQHNVKTPYDFEGVEVFAPSETTYAYDWANVLITHLDYTQWTIQMGQILQKPVINIIHNDTPYQSIQTALRQNFIVYNSKWLKDKLNYKWPSMIMRPPCDRDYYDLCDDPKKNEYITLINLSENKGGEQFYEIASRLPKKKFLGVMGSYDPQIEKDLPNVRIVSNMVDIRPVYKQTRILLMPSEYESWGRTATEAMCSGIPVISSGTPGLRENCGAAGIYLDRLDIDKWVKEIKRLDDFRYYNQVSDKCRERSAELDPKNDLNEFENFLYHAAQSAY
jgi:glycosyltransferase involved in cell wall biosynthesis